MSVILKRDDVLADRFDKLKESLHRVAESSGSEDIRVEIVPVVAEPERVMLSVDELALYYGVPQRTVRHWCQTGRIEAHRIGRQWHIPKEQFPFELGGLERFRVGLSEINKGFSQPPPDDFE